jgi:uncharacterized protein YceH (UPF0502 family)
MVHPSHGRSVTRYRQVFDEQRSIAPSTCSLLAVMMLRGPQTVAELRTRTERMYSFTSLADIEQHLAEAASAGLVQLLERMPGQKEPRWQQLVADEAEIVPASRTSYTSSSTSSFAGSSAGSPPAPQNDPALVERLAELEARVQRLEAALADLL